MTEALIEALDERLCEATSELMKVVISETPYYSVDALRAEIAKYPPEKLRSLVRDDASSVLIARVAEDVVGFCVSTYDDGIIWLAWFGVGKEHRARGIAARLVGAAVASVRARGCHKIWCDTRTTNTESRAVLTRVGFRQVCTLENHWYGHDFLIWERTVA